jgi:deoxyribonuclease V
VDRLPPVHTLAAADVAYPRGEDWAWACALLFRYPELEFLEERHLRFQVAFPYVPGLLSFREGPGLLEVLSLLQGDADLLLFDGQGIAHPQGLGLASHLGVLLQKPSIGCAKSRLIGEYEESLLAPEKGSWLPLLHQGRPVGAAVRARAGVKPLFISPGHLISLKTSIEFVLTCCSRFRIPEPLRQAPLRVERLCRSSAGNGREEHHAVDRL